jgi:hypothetical protein
LKDRERERRERWRGEREQEERDGGRDGRVREGGIEREEGRKR